MQLLIVEKLNKSFGGLKAVHNLDLAVSGGEIVGLIGPNGSGKTTALNLLTGFLKPDKGSIMFDGKEVAGFSRNKVCHCGMARTFQLIKPFLEMSALQNVMVGRAYGSDPTRNLTDAERESLEILDLVGLREKANVDAKDLTLMQRKRLELARALATRPKLLLLDELMAGLNHAETDAAMDTIREIRNKGITILIVEHIVKAIMGLSDRIIVLNMGEKIAEGTAQEIMYDDRVIDVYLGKSHAKN
jgi:branched-chain amino acid transport system ATP-binding protein